MIILSWTLFTLLALLWTGAAWATAAMAGWLGQAIASGSAAQAARDLAALPLPQWLKFWIDPAWLEAMHSALQWAVDLVGSGLPFTGTLAGWLVPAVWLAWGLGFAVLLACAAGAHLMLRRFSRAPQAGAGRRPLPASMRG